jgi:perosamine synthetase
MNDRATQVRIPVYSSNLQGNERRYVDECLDSTWISSRGTFVQRFEQAFANYVGAAHATSVSNGTVALHLALVALGIGPGDEVLVPSFTYVASVNTILQVGARPVFVDSRPDTWQADPEDIRRRITDRTRAVMAVHLYGHPSDMDAIGAICAQHDLRLIEDCAEAFGARIRGRHLGTFGDVATFSFFGNKTITTGEGGMVVTNSGDLCARCAKLKNQGIAQGREYWHDEAAYNYRMTNICAAIGVAQLERADAIVAMKRAVAASYQEELAGCEVELHREAAPDVVHSYWMNSILVPAAEQRDPLRRHLASLGIETRPAVYPVHLFPMYRREGESHPVAESLAARGINLPSSSLLAREDVRHIASAIRRFIAAS